MSNNAEFNDSTETLLKKILTVIANGAGGTLDWSEIVNTPITLGGYGITDAATSAQGALADTAVQPGDVMPVFINVKNTSGAQILKGRAITTTGSVGDTDVAEIELADYTTDKPAVAILNQTLGINETGTAVVVGQITGVNTSGLIKGNIWLDGNGTFIQTRPTTGLLQWLGTIERVNVNTGTIYVNVTSPIKIGTSAGDVAAGNHSHEVANLQSTGALLGQTPVANGSGGITWGTPSGGGADLQEVWMNTGL